MIGACDTLAIFIAYGGGGCVMNNCYLSMATVRAFARIYRIVDGCVTIYIDTSLRDNKEGVYGVVLAPSHRGSRYLDVPFSDICFPSPTPPMIATHTVPETVNFVADHVMPQSARQARSLRDSSRWIVAEDEGMDSLIQERLIVCTAAYLPLCVVATMFVHTFKWTLGDTVERYKAWWVVRGLLEILNVHYDPMATHAHVALNASLMVLLSFDVSCLTFKVNVCEDNVPQLASRT